MVHCCVPECNNHSAKTNLVSYHKIPKDSKLKKTWISCLRRDNLPTLENCYMCSDHFQSECFERDFREQLTGERGRRCLKSDAVPSIFNFSHGGARPPPFCAHLAWVDFFQNGAEKVGKGLWVSSYWILVLKWSTLTLFYRNLVLAMQIWRPFQQIANFYLLVDIYQG